MAEFESDQKKGTSVGSVGRNIAPQGQEENRPKKEIKVTKNLKGLDMEAHQYDFQNAVDAFLNSQRVEAGLPPVVRSETEHDDPLFSEG